MAPVDDIVPAARACFARRGFAGTSISDIEEAAGYKPRSGGVYRHYPSKVAIMEAVIQAELQANREAIIEVPEPAPGTDPREVLEATVRRGLAQLDRQADLTQLVFRDLDQFPELFDRVKQELFEATYRDSAARLAVAKAALGRTDMDTDALAVLMISSMVDFKVKEHLLGYRPLDLDQERLIAEWVRVFAAYAGLPD